jgi:hypothetical protein
LFSMRTGAACWFCFFSLPVLKRHDHLLAGLPSACLCHVPPLPPYPPAHTCWRPPSGPLWNALFYQITVGPSLMPDPLPWTDLNGTFFFTLAVRGTAIIAAFGAATRRLYRSATVDFCAVRAVRPARAGSVLAPCLPRTELHRRLYLPSLPPCLPLTTPYPGDPARFAFRVALPDRTCTAPCGGWRAIRCLFAVAWTARLAGAYDAACVRFLRQPPYTALSRLRWAIVAGRMDGSQDVVLSAPLCCCLPLPSGSLLLVYLPLLRRDGRKTVSSLERGDACCVAWTLRIFSALVRSRLHRSFCADCSFPTPRHGCIHRFCGTLGAALYCPYPFPAPACCGCWRGRGATHGFPRCPHYDAAGGLWFGRMRRGRPAAGWFWCAGRRAPHRMFNYNIQKRYLHSVPALPYFYPCRCYYILPRRRAEGFSRYMVLLTRLLTGNACGAIPSV